MKTILEFSGNKKSIDLLDNDLKNQQKYGYYTRFSFFKHGFNDDDNKISRFLECHHKNSNDYIDYSKKKTSVYLLVKKSNKEKSHLVNFTHGYIELINKIASTYFSQCKHSSFNHFHHLNLDVELKTHLRKTVLRKAVYSDYLIDFMFSNFYQHYQQDNDEISNFLKNNVLNNSDIELDDYYLVSLSFALNRSDDSSNEKLYFFLKDLKDVFEKNHYKHFIFIEKENKTNSNYSYIDFDDFVATKAQEVKRNILNELLNQKDNLDGLIDMITKEINEQDFVNENGDFKLLTTEKSIITKIKNLENNMKTIFQVLKT